MPPAQTPENATRKIRRMAEAIIATIDAVDGGEMDHGVTNAALAGVIGILARRKSDPDVWISGMFAMVRGVRGGDFDRVAQPQPKEPPA